MVCRTISAVLRLKGGFRSRECFECGPLEMGRDVSERAAGERLDFLWSVFSVMQGEQTKVLMA